MSTIKSRIKEHMLNKYAEMGGEQINKALLLSTATALQGYDLDPILHEELLKQQPLAVLLDIEEAKAKIHEYRVRSTHPNAWFEGENTPANPLAGSYASKSVALKIQRIWGGVTGFARAVDAAFIDALASELEGSIEGMANLMEFGCMWGASTDIGFTGDAYQYSGMIPRVWAYAAANSVVDAGGDKISLDDLDAAIAQVASYRGVRQDPRLWLMSTRMRQVVDGLQTKVQIPLTQVTLADGKISLAAYAGAGIYESDYIKPEAVSTSPTASAAAGAGSGTLGSATYYYAISSITRTGEQVVGTQGSVSITGPDDADITWTPDANAVAYVIWRGTASGVHYLLDVIPALTYDANGTVNGTVAAYNDNGSRTLNTNVKPLKTGEQSILLANINSNRGASFVGMVDDMGRPVDRLFSFVELARVKDSFDYMLKGYLALKLVHPNLVGMIRHAKLS